MSGPWMSTMLSSLFSVSGLVQPRYACNGVSFSGDSLLAFSEEEPVSTSIISTDNGNGTASGTWTTSLALVPGDVVRMRGHTTAVLNQDSCTILEGAATSSISYTTKTASFVVTGATSIVRGVTSGATGVLIHDSRITGTTGTLYVKSITGTFQSGEPLTCDTGGAATSSSLASSGKYSYVWTTTGTYTARKPGTGGDAGMPVIPWRSHGRDTLSWAQARCGWRAKFITNWCADGASGAEIVTDLAKACADDSQIVVVCMPTNNMYSDTYDLATLQGYARTAVQMIKSVGKHGIFVGPPIRNSAESAWTSGRRDKHHQYDLWMAAYCRAQGMHYISPLRLKSGSETCINASNANGDANTGWVAADNIHWSNIQAKAVGFAIGDVLTQLIPAEFSPLPVASVVEAVAAGSTKNYNIFPNPLLTGTGGAYTNSSGGTNPTGVVPDGCRIVLNSALGPDATVAMSQIARTVAADGDACGNWWRITVTGAANGGGSAGISLFLCTGSIHAALAKGDETEFAVQLRATSGATPGSGTPAAFQGFNLAASPYQATAGYKTTRLFSTVDPGCYHKESFNNWFRTRKTRVRDTVVNAFYPEGYDPGAPTNPGGNGIVTIGLYWGAAGGDATFDIALPHWWKNLSEA